MQKIAIIQISEEGKNIARLLLSQIFAQKNEAEIISRANVGKRWKDFDAFVFVGAMGICVRTIAPYIKDNTKIRLWYVWTAWALMPFPC